MSIHHKLRFDSDVRRIEVEVRLEPQEPSEGQLDTNLEPVTERHHRLSITMGQWERRGPRSRWQEVSFGQDRESVLAFAKTRKPETMQALERLCEIWAEWHLNDMQAGTDRQKAAIAGMQFDPLDWYGGACKHLESQGLLVDRGYKFGHKWLVKRLPQSVQKEVLELCERLA